ncbi:hypothetical protein AAC387_Pa09g0001 [Persea americana]
MGEKMMRGGVRVLMALAMSMVHGWWAWTCAAAQVHHVVGGDRGWDPSSNIRLWSGGKSFRVGDHIWFTYSAALESVVELRNREEFESCAVNNPIRMYTDGLDKVSLDGQGSRYFASGSLDSCKKGLKLHVHVLPSSPSSEDLTAIVVEGAAAAAAAGPTPSISAPLPVSAALLCAGVLALLCFVTF